MATVMRVVRAQTKPGQAEELARRWEAYFGARSPRPPGLRGARLLVDAAGDRTMALTEWDGEPDAALVEATMREFGAKVAELVTGPATVERYEVAVEIAGGEPA
jgi:heme-degrading monooxygenase HmoA